MTKNIEPIETTECYICLDTINLNENDFLELNCCKNNVHLKCLKEWCVKNNTSNCFICNQTNDIFKELGQNSTFLNNIHYIQIDPIHTTHSIHFPQQNPVIYTQKKIVALTICYMVNFFVLLNLIIILLY